MNDKLNIYRRLSRNRWPHSYVGKFLLTAFIGVHVPLIALIVYVAISLHSWDAALPFLVIAVVATLLGTLATQFIQHRLLTPVIQTASALDAYVNSRTLPDLPREYTDEAGMLMSNAQGCIQHLDDLLRLKNNLLAVLSHDTRSPITTINLASDFCLAILDRDEIDVEELRYMNEKIKEAAAHQFTMMNSLLMLARSDANAIDAQWSSCSPGELLHQSADNIRLQAAAKKIEVMVNDTVEEDLHVELDAAKTEQVLNNILTNAIKFTPTGGIIELGASSGNGYVEFSIRDSGIGMPSEVRSALFTPFTSAQRKGTASEQGSGLGLWICKTFTELQGGTIEVESTPGEGSTFRIRFPKRIAVKGAMPERVEAPALVW